ncbi:MAG: PAS domain-containing protein [Longimonas sp.]|uniref:PAS domain-containing protein n=1 Tax=Longimonas sp. TaxID=2039626 RepID=UPI0039753A17
MPTEASVVSSSRPHASLRSTPNDVDPPRIFSDSFWKRFQNGVEDLPVPVISLDVKGMIEGISLAARRLLGYRLSDDIDPYFFTHVHGQNMHRVMRDLAHMVNAHTRRTSWLVRLQACSGRWQWFRIDVVNRLQMPEQCIVLRLRSA